MTGWIVVAFVVWFAVLLVFARLCRREEYEDDSW